MKDIAGDECAKLGFLVDNLKLEFRMQVIFMSNCFVCSSNVFSKVFFAF